MFRKTIFSIVIRMSSYFLVLVKVFMKSNRTIILIISVLALVLSGLSASAVTETDPTGDVQHWAWDLTNQVYKWQLSTEAKDTDDITELSYTLAGTTFTLSMTLAAAPTE